jgi:hypothetical protein
MAFSEIEKAKIKFQLDEFIQNIRPPIEIRDQLDISYEIKGQSVEIFEIRPHFQSKEIMHIPIAKTTFVLTEKKWKIFWKQSDLKWHSYDPKKSVKNISEFLKVLDEDEYCCFWG